MAKQTVAARRRLTYGLDNLDYKVLYSEQKGACALCTKPKTLVIDHDHQTGKVRGLLCNDCNTSLGKLGDDVAGVQRAIDYLLRAAQN